MHSVLFLSLMNSAPWGGSEEIWYKAAIHLAQKKWKVSICYFHWTGKEKKIADLMKMGCHFYKLSGKNDTNTLLEKINLWSSINKIPFAKYDHVIINQGGWKDVIHGPFKNIYKRLKSYSLIFHNYDTTEQLTPQKKKLFETWTNGAKSNIGDAQKIFTAIEKSNSIEIPNQQVLYNPITFEAPTAPLPYNSIDNKIKFTVLAALDTKRKAQDILIQVLASSKWKKRNWELNIYGKGEDKEYLKKLINDKHLETNIFLRGHSDKVFEILLDTHILFQTTKIDAMPISVVEAMSVARPVIVSNVGDMPLWVKHGYNGWIAEEVTVEKIDLILEQAWQKKENWEQMGEKSFQIFKEKYPANAVTHFLELTGLITTPKYQHENNV